MDTPIEEIIKNIIHIDKSAIVMRDNLEIQIKERKSQVEKEIEKLRQEIVGSQMKKINELRLDEIEKANSMADDIKKKAEEKCNEVYRKFLGLREDLIREIFNEIFIN